MEMAVRMGGGWNWLRIVSRCMNCVEPADCYCSVAVNIYIYIYIVLYSIRALLATVSNRYVWSVWTLKRVWNEKSERTFCVLRIHVLLLLRSSPLCDLPRGHASDKVFESVQWRAVYVHRYSAGLYLYIGIYMERCFPFISFFIVRGNQ